MSEAGSAMEEEQGSAEAGGGGSEKSGKSEMSEKSEKSGGFLQWQSSSD